MEEGLIYSNISNELLEIFRFLDKEVKDKIPKKMIESLEKIENKNHNFQIDKTKELEEQNLMTETKQILSIIYLKYCCTKEEADEIIELSKKNEIIREQQKREKYDPDKIFKKENHNQLGQQPERMELIVVEKVPWYKKVSNFLKKLFGMRG